MARPWLLRTLATLLGSVAFVGFAASITVDTGDDPNARLELRTVDVPGHAPRSFYVIVAETVTVTSDEWTIRGTRIEFDPDAGVVRVVGEGSIVRPDETLIGQDMVLELESGRLDGDDVLVITGSVDVFGQDARRVEGRIRFLEGGFTTCGRCGQQTEDFGFSASRIELLPGDRLLAWNATLLIRERPFIFLPLVVVPLATDERTPRLFVRRAGADALAEVELLWPYVTPPSGLGTLRLRAAIDVDLGNAGPLGIVGGLLGGTPIRTVPAFAVEHRFVTPSGAGTIDVDVQPGTEASPPLPARDRTVSFGVRFEGDDRPDVPVVSLSMVRDDASRRGLVEARGQVTVRRAAVTASVTSRMWVSLLPDGATVPSWGGASSFDAVPLEVRLRSSDGTTVRAAPLTLETASVTFGAYVDDPDPSNRDVAGRDVMSDARVEVVHRAASSPVQVLGARIDVSNDFRGRYYGSGDRQVAWGTTVRVTRSLAGNSRIDATLRRQANEGETPFLADRQTNVSRTDLVVRATTAPFAGASASFDGGFVFSYDREPDEVGWSDTRITASLFGQVRWAALDLVHVARPADRDWGELDVTARLESPFEPWIASASVRATIDLDVVAVPEDDASTRRYETSVGLRDVAVASLATTWTAAEVDTEGGPWSPLEIGVTLGTPRSGDAIPGLAIAVKRDLSQERTLEAAYAAAVTVGSVLVDVDQRWNEEGGRYGTHGFSVAWTDVARMDVEGFEFIPAGWVGMAPDPTVVKPLVVTVESLAASDVRFSATYRTNRVVVDPAGVAAGSVAAERERRDSTLEVKTSIAETRAASGAFRVQVDGFLDYVLSDDARTEAFLRRANVTLQTSWAETVALQGAFGYRGTWDSANERIASGRLTFDDVALVVRPVPTVTVAAVLEDVWELFDAPSSRTAPIDPRPTLFVSWDRCCWATYARWDTRTGEIEVTLGAPGSAAGPRWTWREGPTVPWTPPVVGAGEESP